MGKQFRLCAGAVVFNRNGKVLLGNRIETKDDSWQFPQGGIESGETPEEAARRELFEETGVTSVTTVCTDAKPSHYEFSEKIKANLRKRGIFNDGQDIFFSLFYFTGKESEINVRTAFPEFKGCIWESLDFATANIIEFKKNVYTSAAERFAPLIKRYLENLS